MAGRAGREIAGTHGEKLHIHSLTSSAEDGDFNRRVADNIGVMLGSDPVVLVVKKNSRLLGNLLKWVIHVAGTDGPRPGEKVIRNVPLLLIDDIFGELDKSRRRAVLNNLPVGSQRMITTTHLDWAEDGVEGFVYEISAGTATRHAS